MELRHLRYFVGLADALHFTRAAERLFITQSTLSHQIRQLETFVGVPLFDRDGRSVRLTAPGRAFRVHAERILADAEAARAAIADMRGLTSGFLSLGVIHTFNHSILMPELSRFTRDYPGISIRVDELSTPEIEERLAVGQLDFGVGVPPALSSEIVVEPLFEEDYVAVVARDRSHDSRPDARFADISAMPLAMLSRGFATRRLIDRLWESARQSPTIRIETNSIGALVDLVAMSELTTILPRSITMGDARVFAIGLVDPTPRRGCALFWRRGAHRSAAALAFASRIVEASAASASLHVSRQ